MENLKHISVWNNCLKIIENIVEPQQFSTWFKPLKAVEMHESTLVLEVPTDFFREYLETYFLNVLVMTLRREIGADAKLVYRVRPAGTPRHMDLPASHGVDPVNKPIRMPAASAANPGPFVFPGIEKITINPQLKKEYCFSNLVEGDCNRMAINAGRTIAMNPGHTAFNPLFIFGGPGLGKTHIEQAIGIQIKETNQELVVLYVPANRFKTQYMDAVVKNKVTDFLAFYSKIDVLIVDDIQELATPGAQNAFFHIFNHLHQNGKQLIFTSDRSPAELQNFEERLLSRLKWGLSVHLEAPDYKTRVNMLRSMAEREGMSVSDDIYEFLATNVKTNFRELEGALKSVMAHSTLEHREASLDIAREVISDIVGEEKNEITISSVQRVVCEYFNISSEMLLSPSRKRNIVQARQIAMYMSRNLISCSLSTIGAETGGKDHATVLHACATVQDLMSTDRVFRQYVTDIEKILVRK